MIAQLEAPVILWEALSPVIALVVGSCVVLMAGLLRARAIRGGLVPALSLTTLVVTGGLVVWQWGENVLVVEGALAMDDLTRALTMLFVIAGIACVLLSWRARAAEEAGHGEFHCLLLASIAGMVVLAGAEELVTLFVGFELLSIPLYVLCATEMRRATSLESGLKYLVVGSVGSATLLFGLVLLYGATGQTRFEAIAGVLRAGTVVSDVLFLTSLALIVTGLAFKASIAPFHQWTPDVYEGAPTAITAFMAVATKAAAFGVLLRLFDVALIGAATTWAPALAALAVATILIGNVGALGQSSLKRLLAYSSVAQAGYMLAGVVVSTRLGVQATVFYLSVYLVMNLAAFAVIVARERETGLSDDISSLNGLGASNPWLAWPMTIAMLGLAGLPATAGFFGKIYLIEAVVDNGYAWLGVAIVLGSAISLAYYLRVVAAVWMRAPADVAAAAGSRAAGALPAPGGETAGAAPAFGAGGPRPRIAGGAPGEHEGEDEEDRSIGPLGDRGEPGERPGRAGGEASGSGAGGDAPDVEQAAREGWAGGEPQGRRQRQPFGRADLGGTAGPATDQSGDMSGRSTPDDGAEPRHAVAPQPEVVAVAVLAAAGTIFLGVWPEPLFDVARDAGAALTNLL